MRGKECLKWMIDNQNEWLCKELSNRFTKAMFNGYEFVRIFDGET